MQIEKQRGYYYSQQFYMKIKFYLIFPKKIYGECTEITKYKRVFRFHNLFVLHRHSQSEYEKSICAHVSK